MGRAIVARKAGLLFAIVASVVGAGCTNAPTAELKVFRESVLASNAAATPMLDELSATEKRVRRNDVKVRERATSTVEVYNPALAMYFSDIGDGPATAVFRRGHHVLDRLSEVLLILATGTGATSDVASLEGLASAAAGLLNVIGVGIAAGSAFEALRPGLVELSKDLGRQEARRVIAQVQDRQLVKNLVHALISATPQMFVVLTIEANNRVNSAGATPEATVILLDRSAKVRALLSNYVVLLQQTNLAWDEAFSAAFTRSSGNVALLTERVGELRAAVLATRRTFAEMNAAR
jgi:hypothetical protein